MQDLPENHFRVSTWSFLGKYQLLLLLLLLLIIIHYFFFNNNNNFIHNFQLRTYLNTQKQ